MKTKKLTKKGNVNFSTPDSERRLGGKLSKPKREKKPSIYDEWANDDFAHFDEYDDYEIDELEVI